MKRIAIVALMVLMSFAATARSVHYFTYSQANRTVKYLNAQNEMMIYCGYDYEIATYVLINEVWMERINSAYYEIWVYGFDAYTGDEIYMPLDLQCVWLYGGSRMYNAAQYLRFNASVAYPTFAWHIPAYNPFVRVVHTPGYTRTYHYHVHRHGWMPPAYTYNPGVPPPMPYYYLRTPQQPAPMPTSSWTPGVNRPTINTSVMERTRDKNPTTGTRVSSSHTTSTSTSRSSGAATTGASTSRSGNNTTATGASTTRSGNNTTATGTSTSRSGNNTTATGTSTTRSGNNTTATGASTSRSSAATTPTRSTATSRSTTSASSATTTNTSPTRAAANSVRSATSSSRSGSTTTSTPSSTSRSSATPAASTSRSSAPASTASSSRQSTTRSTSR